MGAEEGHFTGRAKITGRGVDVANGNRVPGIDVGNKDLANQADRHSIQADAMGLLERINLATTGSDIPVVLEELQSLAMSRERAKGAFQYLKSKRLIEANFGISSAARLSAAGHDALPKLSIPQATVIPIRARIDEPTAEIFTLKPGIWGMSIDLKEAWRRLRTRV
jgi:hypothetical protein